MPARDDTCLDLSEIPVRPISCVATTSGLPTLSCPCPGSDRGPVPARTRDRRAARDRGCSLRLQARPSLRGASRRGPLRGAPRPARLPRVLPRFGHATSVTSPCPGTKSATCAGRHPCTRSGSIRTPHGASGGSRSRYASASAPPSTVWRRTRVRTVPPSSPAGTTTASVSGTTGSSTRSTTPSGSCSLHASRTAARSIGS